jgi:predicted SprT family Zn-dependent metalloprotease
MEQKDIEKLAHDLMTKHDLLSKGWYFQFVDRRRPLAFCNHFRKQIAMSAQYGMYNTKEDITDTILHEIAHALVDAKHNHDKTWKEKCIEIGARPEKYAWNVIMPPGKYTGRCPACSHEVQFYSRVRKSKACTKCCVDGKYDEKYKLVITQNY